MLTNLDLMELTEFRRELHRYPELSGEEVETASKIAAALRPMLPTRILTGLGGHGVAAVFDSGKDGPTVLFRAELDALPIEERNDIAWSSQAHGKSHVCGHDGHMTMLLALGRMISRQPVAQGRVILMFQPAEEDGSGAKAVVADPAYQEIKADWAFAIHIEPGRPFGYVSTCPGLVNCASLGLKIKLTGKTAHAADPEDGVSPAQAIADLIPALVALGRGGSIDEDFRLVTITHVKIGEPTFGVAPGDGEIYATLRTAGDEAMESLETTARTLANTAAEKFGLSVDFEVCDNFAASINDPDAYAVATEAMDAIDVAYGDAGVPMRASEDFGVFGWNAKAAMLCLGPGEDYAALHNPDYDFPDDLIPIGSAIFERIARDLLGTA
jgi:amidohydrolase